MLTSELKQLLAQWVQQNRPTTDWTVSFRNQNAPVPERPFVSLLITSQGDIGEPSVGPPDVTGQAVIVKDRQVVLSVQTFGPDAMAAALALYDSLHKHAVQVFLLRDGGVAFVQFMTPVNDIAAVLGTTSEERAQFDVEFRTAAKLLDDVGLIEKVEAIGTFDESTATASIDVDAGG